MSLMSFVSWSAHDILVPANFLYTKTLLRPLLNKAEDGWLRHGFSEKGGNKQKNSCFHWGQEGGYQEPNGETISIQTIVWLEGPMWAIAPPRAWLEWDTELARGQEQGLTQAQAYESWLWDPRASQPGCP